MVVNEGVENYNSFTTSLDIKNTPLRAVSNSSVFWSKKENTMNPEVQVVPKFMKGKRLIFQEMEKRISVFFQRSLLEGQKLRYEVEDKDEKIINAFKQYLSRHQDPNIRLIPIIPANYKKVLKKMPSDNLQELVSPTPMDYIPQLWLSFHSGILKHAPKGLTIKLAKMGVIPKELLYYEHRKTPICVSCQFRMDHKSSSKVKGSSYTPIRKKNHDVLRKCVPMDQLISTQPGLVSHTWGSLARGRIWAANIVVNHCIDIHKASILRSPSTEETIAAKIATEKFFWQHC